MQFGQQLPDEQRRNELETLLSSLKRARSSLGDVTAADYPMFEDGFSEMQNRLDGMIQNAEEELDDIPEWDRGMVRDLVLAHAGSSDTTTERVDNEVVLRFKAGDIGNKTKCRYSVAVTSSNEWFHIEDEDGDWNEVWSN